MRPRRMIALLMLCVGALSACDTSNSRQKKTGEGRPTASSTSIGGPFKLTDQKGKTVTERDLVGKPSLIFFGFTFCPEVCPTTLLHISKWLKDLGPNGGKINTFYVTIDPQRDTQKQLQLYLSSFDPRIRGLTGSPAQIAEVAKAYHVYYKRVNLKNGDYVMDHSTMIYMIDAAGRFAGPIGYVEPDDHVMPLLRDLISRRKPKFRQPDPSTSIERSEG